MDRAFRVIEEKKGLTFTKKIDVFPDERHGTFDGRVVDTIVTVLLR